MPDPNKISFDYDGTLTQTSYRDKAKAFIKDGKDVFIITSRQTANSQPVYDVAQEIGIAKSNIHFTNGQLKWETVKRLNIGTHYDNNPKEIAAIKQNTEAKAILVNQENKPMNKHINSRLTTGDPWAIADGWLETIYSIANRENDIQAVLAQRGEPLKNTRTVEKRGSVAVIPMTGVIMPRLNMMSEISGGTSLQTFALDFNTALNDKSIKAIVINADSPGGVTTGINEAANMIHNSPKPVTVYVQGQAASAMYYLAAGAHSIVMDAMAMVGSIGVVTQIRGKNDDGSLEIVSSNAPDKRPNIATPEGQAVHQKMIDDMEAVFINAVAEFRGLTIEQITAIRGGVLVGQKAVDAGFADKLGSLESVIQELNNTPSITRSNKVDLPTLKAEYPAIYQAAVDEGKATMSAEIQTLTASATTVTTTERTRIAAILDSEEAKGRETQARHIAFNTAMSPEDAKAMLAVAPLSTPAATTTPNPFAAAMDGIPNPKLNPDGSDDTSDDAAKLTAHAASIVAMINPQRGTK